MTAETDEAAVWRVGFLAAVEVNHHAENCRTCDLAMMRGRHEDVCARFRELVGKVMAARRLAADAGLWKTEWEHLGAGVAR